MWINPEGVYFVEILRLKCPQFLFLEMEKEIVDNVNN